MNAISQTGSVEYLRTLRFWKAVEEKYHQRKRQWMEAKSRMITAKLASIRARKEMEQAKREGGNMFDTGQGEAPQSEYEYDARDDEFSDVEPDMFMDPADRYYSLDAESWNQIRNDIMKAQQRDDERKKKFMRRVLLAILILFWLLVGGLYLIYKASTQATLESSIERPAACVFQCDKKTVVDELVQIVFPPVNIDEEI
ncbi:uncharacterized protein LOC123548525 isoform X2 [Mercenaria mercenaria]|uniref:uncharacterized protein LOC123548525 isoform X2 n=1 Tax=Mercenaria mercenaria TaxID=6596 RepID=UPI001E1D2482|nr:uncharacterized protein LOC123548525 isoform X2 [Mercenaria mercenaria]